MTSKRTTKMVTEPTMSDATILMKVEDLINIAMGPPDLNRVNFKMLQTVLHILARQMRMLEQQVEIRIKEGLDDGSLSSEDYDEKAPRDRKKSKGRGGRAEERDEKKQRSRSRGERGARDDYDDRDADRDDRGKEGGRDDRGRDGGRDDRGRRDRSRKSEGGGGGGSGSGRDTDDRDREDQGGKSGKKRKDKNRGGKDDDRDGDDRGGRDDRAGGRDEKGETRSRSKSRDDRDRDRKGRDEDGYDDERGKGKSRKGDKADAGRDDRDYSPEGGKKKKGRKDDDRYDAEGGRYDRDDGGGRGGKGRDRDAEGGERGAKSRTGGRTGSDETIKSGKSTKSAGAGAGSGRGTAGSDYVPTRVPTRVGSIEVVTHSQFMIVEAAVKALEEKAGPIPVPTLPGNAKLRSDIAKGSATLIDTMEAMQVSARVQAAEKAIGRMAELMEQLAVSGALPPEVAGKAVDIKAAADAAVAGVIAGAKGRGVGAGGRGAGRTGVGASGTGVGAGGTGAVAAGTRVGAGGTGVVAGGVGRGGMMDGQEKRAAAGATAAYERGRSVAIDTVSGPGSAAGPRPGMGVRVPSVAQVSVGQGGRPSTLLSHMSVLCGVTNMEMDEALRHLRDDMARSLNTLTSKATTAAEIAITTAKAVADKLDVALKLDNKITTLNTMVMDYSEQLSGFDSGISTQMQGFQEQMMQMRSDLTSGVKQLEQVNNNAETAAILELTERHDLLVNELDATLHTHQQLTTNQGHLSEELRADSSRLAGLLTETDFSHARCELELRMQMCHEKFRKQDHVWMDALKDFAEITSSKAELMQLHAMRDVTLEALKNLHEKVQLLTKILGDPKAAVITRRLAINATCGACGIPALMDPNVEGGPPALPGLRPPGIRPPPPGAPAAPQPLDESDSDSDSYYIPETHSKMCLRLLPEITQDRSKEHICRRWVGGSHTLVSAAMRRERAAAPAPPPPARRYVGAGSDGRQYRLERELPPCRPCQECNYDPPGKEPPEGAECPPAPPKIPGAAEPSPGAAGDQGPGTRWPTMVSIADARRVTIIDDTTLRVIQMPDDPRSVTATTPAGMSRRESSISSRSAISRRASIAGDRIAIADAISDLTPTKATDIGVIVKGKKTFVDEDDVLRVVVKHEVATRKILEGEEDEEAAEEGPGAAAPSKASAPSAEPPEDS